MSKEKIFIVLSLKHSPKKGSHTGAAKSSNTEWERTETVEFVNQLRNRHYTTSAAIGDYINRTMITGARYGMDDYDKFEGYIRTQYSKEIGQLDSLYREQQVVVENPVVDTSPEVFSDEFGNIRARTVFDAA